MAEQNLQKKIKVGAKVLWLYQGDIETGDIIYLEDGLANVLWLEGYKSRNDDVPVGEFLAVYDSKGPEMEFDGWTGRGYILPAGQKWLEAKQAATAE